jgi:hypothetical protein
MAVNGKAKGGQFERDMSKSLSRWLTGGKSEDALWRSAGSGSRSTNSVKKGRGAIQNQASDLTASAIEGYLLMDKFTVECKFYADLQFGSLLFNGTSKLLTFWKQAQRDSRSVNKHAMLIAKQNRRPIVIVLDNQVVVDLLPAHAPRMHFTHHGITIIELDVFLKLVHPDKLKDLRHAPTSTCRQRSTLNRKP